MSLDSILAMKHTWGIISLLSRAAALRDGRIDFNKVIKYDYKLSVKKMQPVT